MKSIQRSITHIIIYVLCSVCLIRGEDSNQNIYPAPKNLEDLKQVQQTIQKHLPQSKAATVYIMVGASSGTGVIVNANGLILTAAHVCEAPKQPVSILFENGQKANGIVLGMDSFLDAAMIQITTPGTWPFANIHTSKRFQLGEWVYAIGHPQGWNAKRGLVTRVGRIIYSDRNTLQSDCTLIGGDSGGPLFDLDGYVIGIHSRVGHSLLENRHISIHDFVNQWDLLRKGEVIQHHAQK